MSIQQEEISIKEFTSGTTFTFFSTHMDTNPVFMAQNPDITITPTIIYFNNINTPIFATNFDGETLWTMNSDNIYVPTQNLSNNFITGHTYVQKLDFIVSPNRVDSFKESFSSSIDSALSASTTGGIPQHTEYVFVDYHEIDDFYVNIKLNRTHATLDTLNVYNNLINSTPTQNSSTGVVFGRLVALQTIKDADGNNIRIPLRNVPVGIFNSSEDYPNSSSVSDNGDRIFLNLKESSEAAEYFNVESFDFDKNKLLRSGSQFTTVPEQYKYITKTNDEGEFVLYDVPTGTQIAVFEVDLLKQGLTRDEIALNFFPFPPDEDANIDQIPNFSFKQFPINIVPTWGTTQTGYTELDVVVNLDLRKWTTYFLPPISLYGQRLEASVAANAGNTLKIQVRNMAKQDYPNTDIKLAEIPNDLDRVFNQQLNWNIEFAQIKNKAEFYKFGCPTIKLPANLYDPKGYRTDANGVPTSQRGVWLSAYQLKVFSDPIKGSYRTTGGIYAWNGSGNYFKSHYNLNFASNVADSDNLQEKEGLGNFPYEQPWSVEYPNKYSIPKKPTDERYRYSADRTPTSNPNLYYLDEPAYNDGDLVGYEVVPNNGSSKGGGFGSQSGFGTWFHNRIAEVITKNFMYKYESGVAWNESYANGYQPSNPGYTRFANISEVIGGEKYQRFESGYGYFLRPSGWPRVARTTWGSDTYFGPDTSHNNTSPAYGLKGNPDNPGPGRTTSVTWNGLWGSEANINDVYNLNNINLALSLDSSSILKKGTLEAYRIIDSNPNNLSESENFILPTYVRLNNYVSASRAFSMHIQNSGTIPVDFENKFGGKAYKNGTTLVSEQEVVQLNPGEYLQAFTDVPIPSSSRLGYTSFELPGNDNYSVENNRYELAKYTIFVEYKGDAASPQPSYYSFSAPAKVFADNYYLKTISSGNQNGWHNYGLNTDATPSGPAAFIYGIAIETNNSSYQL